MGHFYNPHIPAQQGPVNSTPPIPHQLPLTGGDQPQRAMRAVVGMMMVVLASWPADLEPRLTKPNNQRVQNAATIPPPPVQDVPYTRPRFDIYALNQDAYEVSLINSFVVTQGSVDQPPRTSPLSATYQSITNQSWQPEPLLPVVLIDTAEWNVPPVVNGYIAPADVQWQIWAANQPPDPQPVQRLRSIVPTFPTVSQPMPQPPLSVAEITHVVSTWQQSWDAQTYPDNAAWNIPSVAILAHTPAPQLIWTAWEPPPPLPVRPVQIAALTLPTGVQPIPSGPLSVLKLAQFNAAWQQTWGTQTAPESAAWNIPPAAAPPHVGPPQAIWDANQLPWYGPPEPVQIAPLTLVYGQQPPNVGPMRAGTRTILTLTNPPETWAAQSVEPSIAFTIPPPAVDVVPDYIVRIPSDDVVVRIPPDDEDVLV